MEWDRRIAWDAQEHPLLKAAYAYLDRGPQPGPPNSSKWTVTDRIMKRTMQTAAEALRDRVTERTALRFQMEQLALVLRSREEEVEATLEYFAQRDG